jgi:hypothetical protein
MTQDPRILAARDREAYGWKLDSLSDLQHEEAAARRARSAAPISRLLGVDISDGVECHVEGYLKGGVLHITDQYEIIDGKGE